MHLKCRRTRARTRTRRNRRRLEGVTLIEVMVVMIIMALISAGAAVAVMKVYRDSQVKQAQSDAKAVGQAAVMYLIENGECPTPTDLTRAELLEGRSKDPWGNDFEIDCSSGKPVVRSAGPDGQMQTEDDVG